MKKIGVQFKVTDDNQTLTLTVRLSLTIALEVQVITKSKQVRPEYSWLLKGYCQVKKFILQPGFRNREKE